MNTRTPQYFDYLRHAHAAGLDDAQVDALIARCQEDYGNDWNLLELRLLRLCKAIEKGRVSYAEALAPEPEPGSGLNFRVAEEPQDYGDKT